MSHKNFIKLIDCRTLQVSSSKLFGLALACTALRRNKFELVANSWPSVAWRFLSNPKCSLSLMDILIVRKILLFLQKVIEVWWRTVFFQKSNRVVLKKGFRVFNFSEIFRKRKSVINSFTSQEMLFFFIFNSPEKSYILSWIQWRKIGKLISTLKGALETKDQTHVLRTCIVWNGLVPHFEWKISLEIWIYWILSCEKLNFARFMGSSYMMFRTCMPQKFHSFISFIFYGGHFSISFRLLSSRYWPIFFLEQDCNCK